MQKLCHKKLMDKLTISRLTKLLMFHILGSCLVYIAVEGMVKKLFTILFLIKTILTISKVTLIEIVCKRYAP